MNPDWKTYKVSEFADVFNGGTPSTSDECNFGGDIPWITPKDLSNYEFRYILKGERSITENGYKNSSATLVPAGTILLTSRAPVGYLAIAKNPVTTNQGFKNITVKNGFDNQFVYYLLKSNVEFLKSHASGSTFAELSGTTLKNLTFKVPPLPEQRAIADVLSALDDKIDLNRRMNRTLESLAQALFKRLFLDNPEKEEWEETKLGEVINNYDSKRIPISSRLRAERQGIYPYYGATSIMDYIDNFIFDGIYILIAEDGSVIDEEDHPVIQYVWGKFWLNNHAHILKGANGISDEQLLLFLKNVNILPYVTGAVQLKLNQGNLNSIPFILPPKLLCEEFHNMVSPLFNQIRLNVDENRTLIELRDTLLPKLMSGQVRVKI